MLPGSTTRAFGYCLVFSAVLLAGCTTGTTVSFPSGPNTAGAAVGDWNDVTASVFYAASKTEMGLVGNGPAAQVETNEDGSSVAFYLLYTIQDARVHLRVTRPSSAETGPVQISCRIGRFSDPELEQTFIEAFARRLKHLQGVDAAPPG
jgi:hypothetical protein